MRAKSQVTSVAAAHSDAAIAHFQARLSFETDCWDVHHSLENNVANFVLLDVRSADLFQAGHLPSAINLPHAQIHRETLPALPDGGIYVVYCAGPHCNGANKGALKIATLQLPVKEMIGGIEGWKDEGFALVNDEEAASWITKGLSETAFVRPLQDSAAFAIRYFSPKQEIPLCGHATLAAAQVLFETTELSELHFRTAQNLALPVRIMDDAIEMEFPVYQTTSAEVPPRLLSALGLTEVEDIAFNAETNILLLEISSTAVLKKLLPDFPALQRAHDSINGVLVTAPSVDDGFDFHSRYFWPWSGTNEDPVTGGTHTFLAPYWSERLGKSKLRSFQSSARSGSMEIEVLGDTMRIRSQAVVVFEGRLRLGEP